MEFHRISIKSKFPLKSLVGEKDRISRKFPQRSLAFPFAVNLLIERETPPNFDQIEYSKIRIPPTVSERTITRANFHKSEAWKDLSSHESEWAEKEGMMEEEGTIRQRQLLTFFNRALPSPPLLQGRQVFALLDGRRSVGKINSHAISVGATASFVPAQRHKLYTVDCGEGRRVQTETRMKVVREYERFIEPPNTLRTPPPRNLKS